MAIESVVVTVNGQTYTLTYNSTSGKYEGTFTAPTTTSFGMENNAYNCVVRATDDAGNYDEKDGATFSALYLRVKEKTKPTITTTYPSANAFVTNAKPTFTWEVNDADSGVDQSTISIKFDSGNAITSGITKNKNGNKIVCSYTPTSALSEGTHTVYYNASDNDGNAASQKSVAFTIDTVAPNLNVTNPTDGLVTNVPSITIEGTVADITSGLASLTVNGKTVSVSDGAFSSVITLSQGVNNITIIATDNAGKQTTITRTVTLNTIAPVISNVTLTPNPADVGATIKITVTVTETT